MDSEKSFLEKLFILLSKPHISRWPQYLLRALQHKINRKQVST